MKKQILCTAFLLIFAIIGTTSCSTPAKDERSAGRTKDDKEISGKVRTALDEEPVYKFGNVGVKTYAGEVQLSGFVNTDEQKDRAGEIAAQVPGVANVHNALVLKPFASTPTGRTDTPQQNRIYSSPPSKNAPQSTQPPAQQQSNEPK